jgi:cytochrome c553
MNSRALSALQKIILAVSPIAPAELAGRIPGYLFRQFYGFQTGARAGEAPRAMQPVVDRLTKSNMNDLAAYAALLQT